MNTPLFNQLGDTYGPYQLKHRYVIDELKVVMSVIEHTQALCSILHIETNDPENLFCLSFQTHPNSSNGVAHILEHTVLCGSEKYPIKDPFFAMQKRSLNTFMNALTGSDFTCYPAATLNKSDFYNLLEVYLDAAFHPLLLENSFNQEGHRLEFAQRDDPSTPLEIKGIVYNEMKGAMASSESRLWHELLKHLTPDLTYAHNSGGDPEEILKLSYKELLDFFHTFYHPSRCLFYFYGNFPLKGHLDFLEDKILGSVTPLPPLPPIAIQKPFEAPKVVSMKLPAPKAENLDSEDVVAFGFLTAPISDELDVLALTLLDSYLMDTDACKLKKALLDSGLCDTVDAYLDPEMSQVPYALFCKGVKASNHPQLKAIIMGVLNSLALSGISKQELEAPLHQLELARTEIGGDGQPFGLTLFMRSALGFQHGISPEKGLIIHSLFNNLAHKLEDPFFMSRLIEKYFLHNNTVVELIAHACPNLLDEEAKQEKLYLTNLKTSLTTEEKKGLIQKAGLLHQFQKDQEGQTLECLPKIELNDVNPQITSYQLNTLAPGLYGYEAFTNGLIYVDAVLCLQHLTLDELKLIPLLAALITEVGHNGESYEHTLSAMHTYTGGISANCAVYTAIDDPNKTVPVLIFKGKALERNTHPFLDLLHPMIYHPRFDELGRIEELINQLYSHLQNKLPKRAIAYASNLALSTLSDAGYLNHLFYGLPFYEQVKALKLGGKKAIKKLSSDLKALYEKWKTDPTIELIIVTDEHKLKPQQTYIQSLFPHTQTFQPLKSNSYPLEPTKKQAYLIPTSVAFNLKAQKAPGYLDSQAAYLTLAASLLDNVFLHSRVREIGGAYGVGAHYSPILGAFYFHSYRDPHIASTFEAFKEALRDLALGQFSLKELEEAKICVMQHIDTPLSPMAQAMSAYTYSKEGRTEAMRQTFRSNLLKASMNDIINAVCTYLLTDEHTSYVSFCGSDIFKKQAPILKKIDLPLAVIPL